ncbi:MAG: sigma factor-like helix-turn-helix DNA-binding protein [Sphingorhabdus sp.]
MPFKTTADYFQAGADGPALFFGVSGMGRKTVRELESLLHPYKFDPSHPADEKTLAGCTQDFALVAEVLSRTFDHIRLDELLLRYDLSVRTQNFLRRSDFDKMPNEIQFLGRYLQNTTTAHFAMSHRSNIGRKTIDEVHRFIGKWLKQILGQVFEDLSIAEFVYNTIYCKISQPLHSEPLDEMVAKLESFDLSVQTAPLKDLVVDDSDFDWDTMLDSRDPAERKVLISLDAILSEKDKNIVEKRFGLTGDKKTLQQLGDEYGITRERIRQIEARSLKKFRIPSYASIFESILRDCETAVLLKLFRDGTQLSSRALRLVKGALAPHQNFLIKVCYGSITEWLTQNYITHKENNKIVSWSLGQHADVSANFEVGNDAPIHIRILQFVIEQPWPAKLDAICSNFPGHPPALLKEILQTRYSANFSDGHIIALDNLTMRHRLILVIKSVGHGMHTSEIAARHFKMFGVAASEHAVGATLMRLDEALIVARGVYNLYENLDFSQDDLLEIRNTVFDYLTQQETFISSKNIFSQLFSVQTQKYPEQLTEYMLHGILQDDERFDVRRGLMIGLRSRAYDQKFKPLGEEIREFINLNGPANISTIRKALSDRRSILDSTVEALINSTPDVFATGDGQYDNLERVFGGTEEYEISRDAVYVNLLRGPLSIFALKSALSSISLNIDERTVISIIAKDAHLSYREKLAKLVSVPEHVRGYQNLLASETGNSLPSSVEYLKSLDGFSIQQTEDKLTKNDGVMSSIFSEFGS